MNPKPLDAGLADIRYDPKTKEITVSLPEGVAFSFKPITVTGHGSIFRRPIGQDLVRYLEEHSNSIFVHNNGFAPVTFAIGVNPKNKKDREKLTRVLTEINQVALLKGTRK